MRKIVVPENRLIGILERCHTMAEASERLGMSTDVVARRINDLHTRGLVVRRRDMPLVRRVVDDASSES